MCTAATATTSALQVDVTTPTNLRERRYLDRWTAKAVSDLKVRLGHGGPALTGAAFAAGIADVRTVIETTNQANLDAERDRRNVTFEDRHGSALAASTCNFWSMRLVFRGSPASLILTLYCTFPVERKMQENFQFNRCIGL